MALEQMVSILCQFTNNIGFYAIVSFRFIARVNSKINAGQQMGKKLL